MERWLLLAIAVVLSTASATASSAVPFTLDSDGMVRVTASLDGGAPQPMLVDLGAGIDVLTSSAATQAHLAPNDVYTATRMRGDQMRVPVGAIAAVTLGPITAEKPIATEWSALDGHGIAGLISATQFRNAAVTFDYAQGQLVFEDADSLSKRTATMTRVPLSVQDDRGIALTPFVRFDFGGGQSGLCELDTGSQGVYIDQHFASRLGFAKDAVRGTLASLSVLGAPRTHLQNVKVRFEPLIYDCNVGNDFWKNRTFTLDIPHRAFYV